MGQQYVWWQMYCLLSVIQLQRSTSHPKAFKCDIDASCIKGLCTCLHIHDLLISKVLVSFLFWFLVHIPFSYIRAVLLELESHKHLSSLQALHLKVELNMKALQTQGSSSTGHSRTGLVTVRHVGQDGKCPGASWSCIALKLLPADVSVSLSLPPLLNYTSQEDQILFGSEWITLAQF